MRNDPTEVYLCITMNKNRMEVWQVKLIILYYTRIKISARVSRSRPKQRDAFIGVLLCTRLSGKGLSGYRQLILCMSDIL